MPRDFGCGTSRVLDGGPRGPRRKRVGGGGVETFWFGDSRLTCNGASIEIQVASKQCTVSVAMSVTLWFEYELVLMNTVEALLSTLLLVHGGGSLTQQLSLTTCETPTVVVVLL